MEGGKLRVRPDVYELEMFGESTDKAYYKLKLTLQRNAWLAFAVSHSGSMISPEPSRAIVGEPDHDGQVVIARHNLQDYNGPTTAQWPSKNLDRVAAGTDFTNAKLTSGGGKTIMELDVEKTFVEQWADADKSVWMLFAYGKAGETKFTMHEPDSSMWSVAVS